MVYPIIELQIKLIAALKADSQLITLLGSEAIFDAPPKGKKPPHIAIIRHDLISRNSDEALGNEHQILLHIRHNNVSRRAALEIAERVIHIALNENLSGDNLLISHAQHIRTESKIDHKSSTALAAIFMRFLSEPIN